MPDCAIPAWDPYLVHAIDRSKGTAIWPTSCPICDQELGTNAMPLYATIYRGKARRDLVVPMCQVCMSKAWPVVTLNATLLPERSLVGGRQGALSPTTDDGTVEKDELPW